jgi:hypothetical protein
LGILNVAINDDKEENFEIKKTINQLVIKTIPKKIFIEKRIPRYVATPFPPLNFQPYWKNMS